MIPVPTGERISLTTPYGGTLQVAVPASDSNPIIELELEEVGDHPLRLRNGSDNYLVD